MVFAKDAGTAGDLSQFEGKTVALTGRIGLSPGGKPQIVIKSANQVKLADGVAPTTAATPAVPPTPAIPTPKPTPPLAVSESKRVAPAANWANAPQTGDMTRKDLMLLFGYLLTSNEKFVAEDSIVIYPEVPHLTPLATARKSLHLENKHRTTTATHRQGARTLPVPCAEAARERHPPRIGKSLSALHRTSVFNTEARKDFAFSLRYSPSHSASLRLISDFFHTA